MSGRRIDAVRNNMSEEVITMTSSLLFNITTIAYLISMLCFFLHATTQKINIDILRG